MCCRRCRRLCQHWLRLPRIPVLRRSAKVDLAQVPLHWTPRSRLRSEAMRERGAPMATRASWVLTHPRRVAAYLNRRQGHREALGQDRPSVGHDAGGFCRTRPRWRPSCRTLRRFCARLAPIGRCPKRSGPQPLWVCWARWSTGRRNTRKNTSARNFPSSRRCGHWLAAALTPREEDKAAAAQRLSTSELAMVPSLCLRPLCSVAAQSSWTTRCRPTNSALSSRCQSRCAAASCGSTETSRTWTRAVIFSRFCDATVLAALSWSQSTSAASGPITPCASWNAG
mmetsp:Transcript_112849/g.319197  ORF Transcript_112849/g.319197 Transcript_112849/m.319197 type:complete len:283 (+) Transcript_112849:303-1151(+)